MTRRSTVAKCQGDVDYLSRLIGLPPLPPHARRYYDLITKAIAEKKSILLLASVGSLKSTVVNLIMLQHLIAEDPHIIFGSLAGDVVDATGDWLRNQLRVIFGKWIDDLEKKIDGYIWQTSKFCVPSWRPVSKFPSFFGATPGSSWEGLRGAIAFLDDPVDRKVQTSEAARRDALDWFYSTLKARLKVGSPVIIIGSPWHPNDLYMEILARGMEGHAFPIMRHKKPRLFEQFPNLVWHGNEYDLLWAEVWKGIDIEQFKRDNGGHIRFAQRWLCDPEAILGARFKPDWFQFYTEIPKIDFVIYMSIDPATGKRDIGDNTAMIVVGWDSARNIVYVLDCIAGHWDPVMRMRNLKALAAKWNPKKIWIEDVAFQYDFICQAKAETTLPIFGLEPGSRDKESRIDTLAVPIEGGRIIFHNTQQDLINELLYFPDGKYDDRADALELAVRKIIGAGARRYRGGPR